MNVSNLVAAICCLILANLATGAELPAALRPAFEKHKADESALMALRDQSLGNARQKYEATLAAAETAALNARQLNVVAAITRERQTLRNLELSETASPDLPQYLLPARKAFLETVRAIYVDVAKRREKLTVEYIRSLSALQPTAGQELAAAIANEKLRVLSEPASDANLTPPRATVTAPFSTPALPGFSKSLKEWVEVVPWVDHELKEVKFKRNDRRIPDELSGKVDGLGITISGEKKTSTNRVDGQLIAHWGKLALVSAPPPQSGTVVVKEPWGEDGARYGIALELASRKLKTLVRKLSRDVSYDWKYFVEGDTCRLAISKAGELVYEVSAPAADVKAFGFLTTVRYPGDKSKIVVTVNPSRQIK